MPDPRRTVLIVDNDEDLARITRLLLESHGYRCLTASGGAQGVAEFVSEKPDAVVTDLNMPAGDGVLLIDAIRRASRAPIIVVSGFQNQYADRLRRYRNVSLLRKPYDSQALLDLLELGLAEEASRSAA